ncbi:MAG: DUF2095 family protein [Promethearchaeota archaeon]
MEENNKKKDEFKKVNIEENDGLKIIYDKNELKDKFPHLVKEVSSNQRSFKIDSVRMEIENTNEKNSLTSNNFSPEELINPGAIDFIRRCTAPEDALEILNFLLKRKELPLADYLSLKHQILQENGLIKLINKYGGFKRPGFYEKKFGSLRIKKSDNQKE